MREIVKAEIDKMQMNIIKQASNIQEVESVLEVFTEMRRLTEQLPEGGKASTGGAKRGRKPKQQEQ